jgi:hypothetical protein
MGNRTPPQRFDGAEVYFTARVKNVGHFLMSQAS